MFNKDALKYWSTWLTSVGTALLGFFYMFPGEALTVWNSMPAEIKALVPQAVGVKIGLGLMALSLAAKFVKQDFVLAKLKALTGWFVGMLIAGACSLAELLDADDGAVKKNAAIGAMVLALTAGGANFVIEREGWRPDAYRDPIGIWTICAGHTGRVVIDGDDYGVVRAGMKLSYDQCKVLLKQDSEIAHRALAVCVKRPMGSNQSDALISFAINVGNAGACSSVVVQRINMGDLLGAARAFDNWSFVTVAGVKKPMLRPRRQKEAALFLKPDDRNAPWDSTEGHLKELAK